ncbi:MAG: fatty acid metabolism transcriptional regulator FadR, partial [Pantoea sp.]|nr:fatty acid metabolism transcriptional regulator FadR [Pantoea sp.]
LTIQHGKPTRVNDFWETSGLNILETLARLDHDSVPQMMDNVLSVRTNVSSIFIRRAIRHFPDQAREVLKAAEGVDDQADAYSELDYRIFRGLAFASGNPIYGLILNGLKGLYTRVGRHYFSNPEARTLAQRFYQQLLSFCDGTEPENIVMAVRDYGRRSGEIWHSMQKTMPDELHQR